MFATREQLFVKQLLTRGSRHYLLVGLTSPLSGELTWGAHITLTRGMQERVISFPLGEHTSLIEIVCTEWFRYVFRYTTRLGPLFRRLPCRGGFVHYSRS